MRNVALGISFLALTGCVQGTAPANVVPFSEVLATNPAYECTGYDAATDSCTTIGTYEPLGGGRYLSRGTLLLDPNLGPVQIQVTAEERGNRVCSDFDDVLVTTQGASDFQTEVILAEIESLFKEFGQICGVYVPNGAGYIVTAVDGPSWVVSMPGEITRFFDAPKPLRLEN